MTPAGSIYDRNLATGATQVVSTTPGGDDDDRRRGRRSSTSPPTARGSWSARRSPPTPRATTTGTPTCTSAPPPPLSTSPRGRRPACLFAGMTADGIEGLLHDEGQTGRRRHRRKRRPLPGRGRHGRRPGAAHTALHRLRAVGDTDSCDPVANAAATTGTRSAAPPRTLRRRRDRRRRRGRGETTAASTSSVPSSSTATATQTSPTSSSRSPGDAPRFVATLEADNPAVRHGVADSPRRTATATSRSPRRRRLRGLQRRPLADLVQLPGHTEIYRYDALRRLSVDCAVLRSERSRADHATRRSPATASALTDDGGSSSPPPSRSCSGTPTKSRTPTSRPKGVVQLISTGASLERLRHPLGQPRRQGRLLLHPRGARQRRRQRQHGEDLRRPRRRRLPLRPAAPPCAASDECHGAGTERPGPAQHQHRHRRRWQRRSSACRRHLQEALRQAQRQVREEEEQRRRNRASASRATGMAERKMTKETMRMSRRAIGSLFAVLAVAAVIAALAAGQPDDRQLRSRLLEHRGRRPSRPDHEVVLDDPGQPEVAKDVTMNLPAGVFGNPGAIFKCRSADFAVNHCTPGSQVGMITIIANYEGDPNNVLGTGPGLQHGDGQPKTKPPGCAFVAPTVNIPIIDPDHGPQRLATTACGSTVTGISQAIPLNSASTSPSGASPRDLDHDTRTVPDGLARLARRPASAASRVDCLRSPNPRRRPADRAPTPTTRASAPARRCRSRSTSTPTRTPTTRPHGDQQLPGDHRLRKPEVRPRLQRSG